VAAAWRLGAWELLEEHLAAIEEGEEEGGERGGAGAGAGWCGPRGAEGLCGPWAAREAPGPWLHRIVLTAGCLAA
jgi:hypothetical protein